MTSLSVLGIQHSVIHDDDNNRNGNKELAERCDSGDSASNDFDTVMTNQRYTKADGYLTDILV